MYIYVDANIAFCSLIRRLFCSSVVLQLLQSTVKIRARCITNKQQIVHNKFVNRESALNKICIYFMQTL